MTTIDAAATVRLRKPGSIAVLAAMACLALAGCSASGNLLEGTGDTQATLAPTPTPGSQPQASSRVAIAPVIGAPETVAANISSQLAGALQAKGVTVAANPTDAADFTVRGYMVAARERVGTKVSYIWDVTNPNGERVNRITGEEVISGANSRDPWASVSPTVVSEIANKTAASLGAWLPSQSPTPASQPAGAAPTPLAVPTPVATGPVNGQPPQLASNTTNQTTTGSIVRPDGLTVIAPRVSGAPGDGSVSLARALSQELTGNGVTLAPTAAAGAYSVNGDVSLSNPKDGKQSIQINWVVSDPGGRNLGTVSQKNEIPAGSLNGAWGQTADAAAGAAAQGILRLLKQNKGTN